MKVLITGSSGFIGTNVVLAFKDRFDILCIDLQPPKIKSLEDVWIKVDITDLKAFRQAVVEFNPDYILHLAARTDLDGRELGDYAANIVGVCNLMKIASELFSLKKIVITSSMLVCHAGYYPQNQFDYAPTTIYGESKVETEKAVWANKPMCDWAIIRPTSIWGPWFGVPYRNFFDMVLKHRYIHIGYRSCTKTYGYVGNSVYQIEQILFNDTRDENKKVYYIGDNPATNIEEWGNEIATELGFKIKRIPYCLLKSVAYVGDCLKLLSIRFPMTSFRLKNMTTDNIIDLSDTYELAPNPPYSRIEGVRKTLDWLRLA